MDEITAEFTAQQLAEAPPLLCRAKVTVACKTDLGRVRENNEDKFEYYLPEEEAQLARKGLVFLVCDGMGGHAAGQIASELACKTFIQTYLSHPSSEPEPALRAAVAAANRFVLDVGRAIPSRAGMGTTLSGLVLLQGRAITAQVGDSRVYRMRGGVLEQLTDDHTWVDEMIRLGMARELAEADPRKHLITRAIGADQDVQPDIVDHGDLEVGDQFLLCSDGLLNHVPDERILATMSQHAPSEATWKLVGEALQEGGSDNCTVMIVRVDDLAR